ncbi:MAG: substrate-binding periplasmic protein [Fervidobacterium sp.]|uniref:substrate-binding periplasmic protein n=1 Tax=Fervidobacterium sp. TaxID=1871331 RepID=UPI00404AC00E
MRIFEIFFIVTLVVLFSVAAFSQSPTILYTYAQDIVPKYIVQENNISGFCHDIIIELNKELKKDNVEIRYKSSTARPIQQIINSLSNKEIQIFVGVPHSEEWEKSVKYVRLPLYGVREMFIIKSDMENVLNVKESMKVGVIGGTVTARKVPNMPQRQEIVEYKNIAEAIEALEKGKVDTLFLSSLVAGHYISQSKGKYKSMNAPSEKSYRYIIISKSVDDKVTKVVESALKKLLVSGVIDKLIKKYGLEGYVLPENVVEILLVDWKPYEWYDKGKKEWVGMDVDVVKKVFSELGFKPVFLTFPWTRCLELMKMKMYDGVMSVRDIEERKDFLAFPKEPISTGVDVLFKLKSKNINISSLENIPKQALCGFTDGYAYGDWFWNAKFRKINVSTDEMGFELLKAGRIDLFVCNLIVGKHIVQEMKLDVEHSPTFGEKMIYHVAFSKNFHGVYLADIFSEKLRELKSTSEYRNILKKYGIKYEEMWNY